MRTDQQLFFNSSIACNAIVEKRKNKKYNHRRITKYGSASIAKSEGVYVNGKQFGLRDHIESILTQIYA
jgi:hypothetical protein